MKRDVISVAVIWVVLTAVGEAIVLSLNPFPLVAAREATIVDSAFRLLMILGTPVAALVLAWLGYNLVKFRARDGSLEDGIPLRGNRPLAWGWLLVSTGLAVFVVFNPGLKGINELNANNQADLVVQIEAVQWHWNVTYPEYDLSYDQAVQLALPVNTRVKFEITSKDVIHSFWIPAFRTKVDAVPGQTTTLYVTPTQTGNFEDDFNLRVQCAELCGTGHPRMQMGLRILESAEFAHWLEQAQANTGSSMEMEMPGMDMDMDSEDMDMDTDSDDMDMDSDGMDMNTNADEMNMNADSDEMNMNSDSDMDMESDNMNGDQ